jgi:hypothetical protein
MAGLDQAIQTYVMPPGSNPGGVVKAYILQYCVIIIHHRVGAATVG